MQDDPRVLVSTDWLAARLDDPQLRVLDASWHMPASGRDARAEFEAAHIPGARFFDIDAISDTRSALPHMAPPPETFASRVRALGVGDGQQVVIYDDSAVRSAARAWWTFRLMGYRDVAVLDGGLGKWRAEGRALDSQPAMIRDRHLTPRRQPDLVCDVTQVARAAKLGNPQIVDARAPERFRGEAPEPRPGLRAGHIPGSLNLPFGRLLNQDGTLKAPGDLRKAFTDAGVDLARPVITTCGSGVTAAILFLALERIGHQNHALYDGSWTEWGSFPDLTIATGDA
ncbi:3-mercaptopyruvate sulfurtransferase [Paracoccus bogoriensis]|uniref:3-mercaptopyruvate sulfurtransferase n=1 Tax=Paracoccus bogoriensis TaxID=242065 RepID=UPI001CA5AFB4|nr:3-mercaptopyruvate sulfurtransferase [Paracoccus bogoriensis]MBW7055262.1 3-mercaptopyruvate sulfurtransferase [Paracoccus bogoriensis]